MTDEIKLPPLPDAKLMHGLARLHGRPEFDATEMQAYARQAVLDERERVLSLVASEQATWQTMGEEDAVSACRIISAAIRTPRQDKTAEIRRANDAKDAERYRWLRDQACNQLYLTRNGDHACNYMTAAEWIEKTVPEDFADVDPMELQKMKDTNTIWQLQIYPNTPIGFNVWYGATLEAVADAAMADAASPTNGSHQ